jgi:uronate dehydrogenase
MTSPSAEPKYRVLVSGAAGAVGKPVCDGLRARGHFVRSLDRREATNVDENHIGDMHDPAVIDAAMQSMDSLVHLAAEPDDCDFLTRLLPSNIIAMYHVMEMARKHNLRRTVLASSIQAGGRRDESGILRLDGSTPRNHYAVSKLYAEAIGHMYHLRYGLSVIAVRIGWFPRNPGEAKRLMERNGFNVYLSHRDTGRLFSATVEAPEVGYSLIYGASKPKDPRTGLDLSSARQLGYEPMDVFPEGLPFEVPMPT